MTTLSMNEYKALAQLVKTTSTKTNKWVRVEALQDPYRHAGAPFQIVDNGTLSGALESLRNHGFAYVDKGQCKLSVAGLEAHANGPYARKWDAS